MLAAHYEGLTRGDAAAALLPFAETAETEAVLMSLVRKRTGTLSALAAGAGLGEEDTQAALGELQAAQLVDTAAGLVYYPTELAFKLERELRSLRAKL